MVVRREVVFASHHLQYSRLWAVVIDPILQKRGEEEDVEDGNGDQDTRGI